MAALALGLSPAEWALVLARFDEALDQAEEQRLAWAAALGLPPAQAQALARLIGEQAGLQAQGFLAGPATLALPEVSGPVAPLPYERVGPYRLIRLIGEGGMSRVYLAERDDDTLRRQVALKLPHAGPGQQALADRLLRERDALAGLEHPHIARLYDVVLSADGLPCLVLAYIDGLPLTQYCQAQRLSLTARLALFAQVLDAVRHAHAHLVLHRDLKPNNILVDAQGQVHLLDFGIAKMLDDAGAADGALTQLSGPALTPDYAAPEQISGAPLGTACDVYALGVILFELLTGQRPYRLARGTRAALEEAILAAEPPRPSSCWAGRPAADAQPWQAEPRALQRRLAGDLDAVVLQALRKSPADRYPTVDALALDLQRWLSHEPVSARHERLTERLRRLVRRHALALGAGGAVAVSLLGGLGVSLWQAQLAREEARRAEAIKDFMVGLFEASSLNQADAVRKSRQTVRELLAHSAQALQTGLGDQPALRIELQGLVGRLLSELALTDTALALRRTRIAQLAQAEPALRMEAWRELAQTHQQRGDDREAREALWQALAVAPDAREPAVRRERAASQAALAALALASAGPMAERAAVDEAVQTLRQLAPDSALLAQALATQAQWRQEQGQHPAALALAREALGIEQRVYARQPMQLALAHYRHGLAVWHQLGDLSAAAPALQTAWSRLQASAGPDHVDTALVELQLGLLQLYRGQETEALARLNHAREVLEAQAEHLDPDHLTSARLYEIEAHLQAGRYREAAPLLQQVRQTWQVADGGATSLAWQRYGDLQQVELWSQTGQDAAALRLLAQWRERLRPAEGSGWTPDLIELRLREADVHQAAGRAARALTLLDELAAAEPELTRRADWQSRRVSLLLDLGRGADALPLAQALHQAVMAQAPELRQLGDTVAAQQRLARAWLAVGQAQQALPLFTQAMAAQRAAGEGNLYLASLRAHHALALAQAGRQLAAQAELAQAEAGLRSQPQLGPAWWRAVHETQAVLARTPPSLWR